MTSGNSAFELVSAHGWRGGLRNLLRSEFGRWWKTNLWWRQSLMWVVILNGILAGIIWNSDAADILEGPALYSIFSGLFPAIAVVIIMQDVLVGEKENGTAAWVLSKPVSRQAFILAKLAAHTVGVVVSMVLLPGMLAYTQMGLASGSWLSPLDFLAGQSVIAVNMVFYLCLTLMLGAFFSHRAPVIGIPLALAFGQQLLLGFLPWLIQVLPWTLTMPMNGSDVPSISTALMVGATPKNLTPLVVALIMIVLFVGLALWRFEREEF